MDVPFIILEPGCVPQMAMMPECSFVKLRSLLGASILEVVDVQDPRFELKHILLVDEDGRSKGLEFNRIASEAAHQELVGRVISILLEDFQKLPYDLEKENDKMQ